MPPNDAKQSKLPVILTIIFGVFIVGLIDFIGVYLISIVTMYGGGWMWREPEAWYYPVVLIILVASFLLCVFLIIKLYRLLVNLFVSNTYEVVTPKYIYIIAILLPVALPVLAYSYFNYTNYLYEQQQIQIGECLSQNINYEDISNTCKKLINRKDFEEQKADDCKFQRNEYDGACEYLDESEQFDADQL